VANLPPRNANLPLEILRHGTVVEPVDLFAEDGAPSQGLLYQRPDGIGGIGVHLMHPRTDQSRNYNIPKLVEAGCVVLARSGRSVNNDSDTVHEELLLDFAAGIVALRERGVDKVVLLGNSGGAPLAALYQAEATTTPAGRAAPDRSITRVDLRSANLPPADGFVSIGGHLGEGTTLGRLLDGSVIDEHDRLSTDPALDIYDPGNGFRLPVASTRYSLDFVETVRAAQLARVGRIDALARDALDASAAARTALEDLGPQPPESRSRLWLERRAADRSYLVVHRTIADPALLDLEIDPDDRLAGGFDAHPRPDLQNYRQAGFAHLLSPRAWLSTWSALSSHARMLDCIARLSVPTLIVHYAGDIFCRLADARALADACGAADKELVILGHADHYGRQIAADGKLGPRLAAGPDAVVRWLASRFPFAIDQTWGNSATC
jgi:pimeloyl-ACP methyl ester carboxylesterase